MGSISENPDGSINIDITPEEFLGDVEKDARSTVEFYSGPETQGFMRMMGLDPDEMIGLAQRDLDRAENDRRTLIVDEEGDDA